MIDGTTDKTQSTAADSAPSNLDTKAAAAKSTGEAMTGLADSLKQMDGMLAAWNKIDENLFGTPKLKLKSGNDGTDIKGAETKTDKPELKEIDKKMYQVVKDPDFLDIPLSRENVKVTNTGQNSFRFDCKLDRPACQPQADGGVLKTESNIAATVKITMGADGQAEKIEFANFKNVKGDGTVFGISAKNTTITDARLTKEKDGITGSYDLAVLVGGKGWKIDKNQLPSVESFHQLAGQLALRMKENGLLNDGKHPELRRLADLAEKAELASSQRVSPNKGVGS